MWKVRTFHVSYSNSSVHHICQLYLPVIAVSRNPPLCPLVFLPQWCDISHIGCDTSQMLAWPQSGLSLDICHTKVVPAAFSNQIVYFTSKRKNTLPTDICVYKQFDLAGAVLQSPPSLDD